MAEAGNVSGVGEFLQLMTDNGFQIGDVTWGSALKACMIARAPAVADFCMEQMAQSNISATVIHYKLAMGAYAGRKVERILALAEEAKRHGCDKDTYFLEMQVASLLGFCPREKRVQSANCGPASKSSASRGCPCDNQSRQVSGSNSQLAHTILSVTFARGSAK